MSTFLRIITAAVMTLAMSSSAAFAEQTYFVIKVADGSKPDFAVTESVIEKLEPVSYETTLPGMDAVKRKVSGPLMRDLLSAAGMSGEIADMVALDKYEIRIPVSDFSKFEVIAAIEIDGKKLSVRDKGPAWIVYPRGDNPELDTSVYEQRSIWQLSEVNLK